jgi:hypothetical protein
MKTIFQTCDNEIFEDRTAAVNHEDELFEAWLHLLIGGNAKPPLRDLVQHFNDSPKLTCDIQDEFYGTPWEVLKVMLRIYWDDNNNMGVIK